MQLSIATRPPAGITTATRLATATFPNDWAREPGDAPGSWDSSFHMNPALAPGSTGPLFTEGRDTFAASVVQAAELARATRGGTGPFPAHAVLRDAATGAFWLTALGGPITHSSGVSVGAIDGWNYSQGLHARSANPALQALVGGETFIDFTSSDRGEKQQLPAG